MTSQRAIRERLAQEGLQGSLEALNLLEREKNKFEDGAVKEAIRITIEEGRVRVTSGILRRAIDGIK